MEAVIGMTGTEAEEDMTEMAGVHRIAWGTLPSSPCSVMG